MENSHLTYFKVENFKKFDSLEVNDIGQFNLIVGDNNVGKTCLLEALLFDEDGEILNIKPIEVYEVVSFYTMYNQRPVGKYMFEFCQTSPCCLNGVENLMDYTCNKLGVKVGEPTADGMFEVRGVECLGACGYAPMMQLGDFYQEHLNEEKIDQLIADCRDNKINLLEK